MGNDGGSIPKRRELVKEAAKAPTAAQIKEAQQESQEHAWNHCALSSKPLATPVVSDGAGLLYNKDSVIEYLLAEEKSAEQEKVVDGRVKGLKDVVEVKFEVDDGEAAAVDKRNGSGTSRGEKWVCPVTREEMGPNAKAVYLVPCGHAFAGNVVKEVDERICMKCNEPYAENDVIPILPTLPTDIARLSLRLKTLREKGLTHALKKAPGSKKRKKGADKEAVDTSNGDTARVDSAKGSSTPEDDKKSESNAKKTEKPAPPPPNSNGIKNASTAYLTKKVLEEQEERNKRRKLGQNDNVKSLFSKGGVVPSNKNSADYMTRGFSIGKK
ncbi:DUF602-domain-containing protein [Periconia macrospinosa]|uniref:DUF602-domain-containing protein n=1 Tax=Periconia macrospinosa TaxID=97972 RepID=A0A2V1E6W2_9PLEO|nr:DUF602-domain-containing protein [Periconia macrospinosa]